LSKLLRAHVCAAVSSAVPAPDAAIWQPDARLSAPDAAGWKPEARTRNGVKAHLWDRLLDFQP